MVFKVLPAPRPAPTRPAGAEAAEKIAENVAQIGVNAEWVSPSRRAAKPRMSEAIIGGPLLRIAQHVVGFVGLFEERLRIGIGAHVRVIFTRLAPKRPLDLLRAGPVRHAQHFIVIAFARHQNNPVDSYAWDWSDRSHRYLKSLARI